MQQRQQESHPQQKQAAAAAEAATEAPAAEASGSSSRKAGVRSDSNTRGCEGQASLFRATAKPIHAKTELKHTERGTQHYSNGRPTPVCDPYRPNRKTPLLLFLIVTHSPSMKGPRLNFHAERKLAGHPKTTFFFWES